MDNQSIELITRMVLETVQNRKLLLRMVMWFRLVCLQDISI